MLSNSGVIRQENRADRCMTAIKKYKIKKSRKTISFSLKTPNRAEIIKRLFELLNFIYSLED